jgi:hypothetical protein
MKHVVFCGEGIDWPMLYRQNSFARKGNGRTKLAGGVGDGARARRDWSSSCMYL